MLEFKFLERVLLLYDIATWLDLPLHIFIIYSRNETLSQF